MRRGSHQALRPSSAITAGTSVMRTTNASTSTPKASDRPIDLMIGSGAQDEGREDGGHDDRRGRHHPAAVAEAGDDRPALASPACTKCSRIRETRNTS